MTGTSIRVLDPRAFAEEAVADAARLAALDGATVALLWNNRPRGDVVLRGVGAVLEERFRAKTVFVQKLRVGTGAPPEIIAQVAKEAQAAVVGVGD